MTADLSGNSVDELVRAAGRKLGDRGEAARLASLALKQPLSWIFAHGDEPLSDSVAQRFAQMVERRAQGVPFAYIAGRRGFFGRDFSVSPAVLIPRPETEHLVEWCLELAIPEKARVLDVGTGSGCIILSLAAERPQWHCTATDISKEALAIAGINRERLKLPHVRLMQGHLLEPAGDTSYDLVVSNPPYVGAQDPHLKNGDIRHEPQIALASGQDGLEHLRTIVEVAPDRLAPGGWLLLEHGYDQAEAVRDLLVAREFTQVESRRDLAGIERVTGGRVGF